MIQAPVPIFLRNLFFGSYLVSSLIFLLEFVLLIWVLLERVDPSFSEEFLDPATSIEASQFFVEGKSWDL